MKLWVDVAFDLLEHKESAEPVCTYVGMGFGSRLYRLGLYSSVSGTEGGYSPLFTPGSFESTNARKPRVSAM